MWFSEIPIELLIVLNQMILIKIHSAQAIINSRHRQLYYGNSNHNYGQNSNRLDLNLNEVDGGTRTYLSNKHPLWILQDQVQHGSVDYKTFITTTTTTRRTTTKVPFYQQHCCNNYHHQQQQQQQRHYHRNALRKHFTAPSSLATIRRQQVHLPQNYFRSPRKQQHHTESQHHNDHAVAVSKQRQKLYSRNSIPHTSPSMPIFDNMPGDDNDHPIPMFIYNGPKGEIMFNTMMSAHRYPMQEPVPGQILYPPTVPIFRPKPIVERFHLENGQLLNLTLIPFYAHEAINPMAASATADIARIPTPTPPVPTIIYGKPSVDNGQTQQIKYRHLKKPKQYNVYRSPTEVQWHPSPDVTQTRYDELSDSITATTTSFPMALARPIQYNHRYTAFDVPTTQITANSAGTEMPIMDIGEKNNDNDNFSIIYVDQSLEKPATTTTTSSSATSRTTLTEAAPTKSPLLSSRYTITDELYAFPIFTLGKLLKPEKTNTSSSDLAADKSDTWFILNSRYKGHYKHNENYRLSSKYIQNAVTEETNIQMMEQNTARQTTDMGSSGGTV